MLMGKWIISFYRLFEHSSTVAAVTQKNTPPNKNDCNKERNQVSQSSEWKKRIVTQIVDKWKKREDENVGDGKLKTNKENALAFIPYSVDVCWVFLCERTLFARVHGWERKRSWDGREWIKSEKIETMPENSTSIVHQRIHSYVHIWFLYVFFKNKFAFNSSQKQQWLNAQHHLLTTTVSRCAHFPWRMKWNNIDDKLVTVVCIVWHGPKTRKKRTSLAFLCLYVFVLKNFVDVVANSNLIASVDLFFYTICVR